MRRLAVFISYLLHPVFMLTYICSFFLFTENYFSYFMSPAKKIFLFAAVVIFSVVLPLLNVTVLKKLGFIRNIYMNESAERFMPYVSSIVLHAGLLYILHDLDLPFFFKFIIIASIAVLFTLLICNFFTRLSAHAASAGGAFGILIFYEYITFSPALLPLAVCILLAGLAGFARLFLEAHTPRQVYSGFIAGTLSSLLCLIFLMLFNYRF